MQQIPPPISPLQVAAYVVGAVLAVPTLIAIVKVIFFVAAANEKLGSTASGMKDVKDSLDKFKHFVRNELDHLDKRQFSTERDIEQLKRDVAT